MSKKRIITLLGDSIIDNGAYVQQGEPDVAKQLQDLLPEHVVIKRAVDGAVCADVLSSQVANLEKTDCIILSAGGNDALQHIEILETATATTAKDVLVRLGTIRDRKPPHVQLEENSPPQSAPTTQWCGLRLMTRYT
jgi:lysophospholipase L1-like esterase